MARARNIKHGFFTNDQLAEMPALGRLLFIGLWTIADREGRLEDRPKKIKAEVLPYDECNLDDLLTELHERGFITRYAVEDKAFIQINNFSKHQNPHVKEAASTIPAPCNPDTSTIQAEKSTERATLIPDSGFLIPEEKALSDSDKPKSDLTQKAKQVIDHLNEKTGCRYRHVEANLTLVKARLKEGFSVDDCLAVIDTKVREWSGNPDFEKYLRPETLFARSKFASYSGQSAATAVRDWQ